MDANETSLGFRELEERVLRAIEDAETDPGLPKLDKRFLAIGRTGIQQSFMALNRAVYGEPPRISFPEDEE